MGFILEMLLAIIVIGGLFVFMMGFAVQILRSKKTIYSWSILGGLAFFLFLVTSQFVEFFF